MELEKELRKQEYEENLDKIAGIKNTKFSKLINLENELDNFKKLCEDYITVLEYANPNSDTLKNVKNKINEKRESIDSLLEEFIV